MRILLRLLVALLGLAVAAVGFLVAVEVGWAWWQPRLAGLILPWPAWLAHLRTLTWADLSVRITSAVVAAAGLLLLLIAATSRQPRRLPLEAPAEQVTVVTTPRSLARVVGGAVRGLDGVTGATVTASRRRVRVRAWSRFSTKEELMPVVTEAATEAVAGVPLPRTPKVSVVVDKVRESR